MHRFNATPTETKVKPLTSVKNKINCHP